VQLAAGLVSMCEYHIVAYGAVLAGVVIFIPVLVVVLGKWNLSSAISRGQDRTGL
jgi:hypothetical protein